MDAAVTYPSDGTVPYPSMILKRAIELFVEPWDVVPGEDASDEEWDAAFEAHWRKIDARKKAAAQAWEEASWDRNADWMQMTCLPYRIVDRM
jgi:hypothetical protein